MKLFSRFRSEQVKPDEESSEQRAVRRMRELGISNFSILPDSAEPLPADIWERIDLNALHNSVERHNLGFFQSLSPEERGYFFSPEDRAHFEDLIKTPGNPPQ